jgi:hypothetical protein
MSTSSIRNMLIQRSIGWRSTGQPYPPSILPTGSSLLNLSPITHLSSISFPIDPRMAANTGHRRWALAAVGEGPVGHRPRGTAIGCLRRGLPARWPPVARARSSVCGLNLTLWRQWAQPSAQGPRHKASRCRCVRLDRLRHAGHVTPSSEP